MGKRAPNDPPDVYALGYDEALRHVLWAAADAETADEVRAAVLSLVRAGQQAGAVHG